MKIMRVYQTQVISKPIFCWQIFSLSLHKFLLQIPIEISPVLRNLIAVIFLGPLFSFIGIVISIITRKSRKIHPVLWISGIISCMLSFIVCTFVFIVLIMLMAAKQVLKPQDVPKLLGVGEVSKAIEVSKIDNQKNILKNKHLRECYEPYHVCERASLSQF